MKLVILLLNFAIVVSAVTKCPKFECDTNTAMNETEVCFQHDGKDPVELIKIQKCKNEKKKCFIPGKKYAWVNSNQQFVTADKRAKTENKKLSQVYNQMTEASCTTPAVQKRNLLNGRKCTYHHQCMSRICNDETSYCVWRTSDESCSSHLQCNAGLACRANTIWPYETTCLAMADVGSFCMTDFDCKPRNFCWQIDKQSDGKICMEKHSAPDRTKFFWDKAMWPSITKESVMFHGQYCQSGVAFRLKDQNQAECISFDEISQLSSSGSESKMVAPFQCKPDGKTLCNYKKNGKKYFELLCECGLRTDENGADLGYCPIPELQKIKHNIKWMKKMWNGDNCHTYDRTELEAQYECGIQQNYGVMKAVTNTYFEISYYPYIQGKNDDCMQNFIVDSAKNSLKII